ncbi:MAG: potassium transporter TrkG [Sphingomonadaceae bacterium]
MKRTILHPTRIIPAAFLIGISVGTLLLMLPVARAEPGGAPFVVALFTATSAFCVTGLTVVETGTYWSGVGHAIILLLLQLGGLGIMTGATLLGLLVTGRTRLNARLLARAEMRSLDLGDVSGVLRIVVIATFAVEAVLALVLALNFMAVDGLPLGQAAWNGIFHAVSAWNNAGFNLSALDTPGLGRDPILLLGLMVGVILGGTGFPVLHELRQEWRTPRTWSIHTKLTLFGTGVLLLVGWLVVLAAEWNNPETLGGASIRWKLLEALFHSVMTRSGGFATLDMNALHAESQTLSWGLMMIGGGSASTAGGIRVTTFFLLGFVALSEVRGQADANIFRRRIPVDVQRQALLIALLAVGTVSLAVFFLLIVSDLPIAMVVFDAISAFATVGLSTGAAALMPPEGQVMLSVLMYVGRVGIVTAAAAVALRVGDPQYRYPEERPIIG